MLNNIAIKKLCRIWLLIMVAASLIGCEAIRTMDSFDGILNNKVEPEPEVATLSRAESAFFDGSYVLAEKLFAEVRRNSDKPQYRNQAQYGLICLSIATAEGMDGLKKAFAMMAKWQKPGVEMEGYMENPEMMFVALNKKTGLLDCDTEIKVISAKKKMAVSKEHQLEVEQLKSTIKKLEHQISVLEAIDLEIQEKRKPI